MPTTRALALFAALPLVVLASRRTPPTEEECKARLDGIYADIEAGDLDAALKSSESLDRKVREIDRKYQHAHVHVVLHTGWRVGTHPGPIPLL